MLLHSCGCTFDCAICGGSRSAYEVVVRERAGMRSPEKLVSDARLISTFSRTPIFLVHDPRVGGQLNDLKLEAGLIDDHPHATVARHPSFRAVALESGAATGESLVGEDELKWKTSTRSLPVLRMP